MMDSVNFNDWLGRWRGGDASAVEPLIRAVYPRLEGLARKMLRGFPNVRRSSDTMDVVQNSVLRLMRSLRQLDPPPTTTREFYGLAAAEIRRELLDLARGAAAGKRQIEVPLVADAAGPDGGDLERWAAFHEAVERLPAEEREVVGLVFYHGWTQPQVAELFGVSEKTVSRRWRSALLRLNEEVGGELPE